MLFKRKPAPPQPPASPSEALRSELTALLAGYDDFAEQFRKGIPLNPPDAILGADERAIPLFQRTNAQGERTGVLFHYTRDLKSLDPNAQIDLITIFGNALMIVQLLRNIAAKGGSRDSGEIDALVAQIDRQRVHIAMFLRVLARECIATGLLTGKLSDAEVDTAMRRLADEDRTVLRGLLERALIPKVIAQIIEPGLKGFPLYVEQKITEAEPKSFNGVWLPPELAAQYLDHLAKQQAQTLAQRQSA